MARSKYIYTVQDGRKVVGTFTVKHELIDALCLEGGVKGYKILRHRDGGRLAGEYHIDPFDITKEIEEYIGK